MMAAVLMNQGAPMSMQWETEMRDLIEDDESDDVLQPGESEDDFFCFSECATDPCLGDWMHSIA
jgi:hypothetical protein